MRALITGITGQDGSYLLEFLLARGYEVHGLVRRTSQFSRERIDPILADESVADRVTLHYGDLTDASSINRVLEKSAPDEIYNLGAQSHVGISFTCPEVTADINALGTLRILDAIRASGLDTKFYQASSSELYGGVAATPQTERTPFNPLSPYAVSKAFAYDVTKLHRSAYGMFACNGILFNHESPRRGENFVTRKITLSLAGVLEGRLPCIRLGNLEARRDWGFAGDYVEAMWVMLQQDEPGDYVVGTGEQHSVREFVELAAGEVGIELAWEGEGLDEVGRDAGSGEVIVRVDPRYLRPLDVQSLCADASLAREKLGWEPRTSFRELVHMMVAADVDAGFLKARGVA